jgi:hypothetical protein
MDWVGQMVDNRLNEINRVSKTFDVTKPKVGGQQALRLTPAIKARIKGEALPLKQPSSQEPDLIKAFSNAK